MRENRGVGFDGGIPVELAQKRNETTTLPFCVIFLGQPFCPQGQYPCIMIEMTMGAGSWGGKTRDMTHDGAVGQKQCLERLS